VLPSIKCSANGCIARECEQQALNRWKRVSREDMKLTVVPDRTKRVKEARDGAKKEIEAYRKAKDDEFKKFEAEVRVGILLIPPSLLDLS
jgi:Vacuolar (H+)-ATPase G subunit